MVMTEAKDPTRSTVHHSWKLVLLTPRTAIWPGQWPVHRAGEAASFLASAKDFGEEGHQAQNRRNLTGMYKRWPKRPKIFRRATPIPINVISVCWYVTNPGLDQMTKYNFDRNSDEMCPLRLDLLSIITANKAPLSNIHWIIVILMIFFCWRSTIVFLEIKIMPCYYKNEAWIIMSD